MLKFNIKEGKVFVDALHLGLKTFERLEKRYEGDMLVKIYTYIHLVSQIDKDAPYFSAAYEEVEGLAKLQLFNTEEWLTIEKRGLNGAVKEYKNMYGTPEIRIVGIFNAKIDQIRQLIENTKPQITQYESNSGVVGHASNLPIITKTMTDLDGLLVAKDKLEAKIRKESTIGKMRAGKKPSMLEETMM